MSEALWGQLLLFASGVLSFIAIIYAARKKATPSPLLALERIVQGVSDENERLRERQAELEAEIKKVRDQGEAEKIHHQQDIETVRQQVRAAENRLQECYDEIQRRQKEYDDQLARLYQRLGKQDD